MPLFGHRERGPAALPVPPFPPDPPPVEGPAPFPSGGDPVAVLAAHGVTLPPPTQQLQAATDLPVWTVPVSDEAAGLVRWDAVRRAHPATGLWPLLITDTTWTSTAAGFEEQPRPVSPLDAAAWLTDRAESELPQLLRNPPPAWRRPDPSDWAERVAECPDAPDRLLLVPATAGWAVLGLLGWDGAVNHDILGDEHTAVLRRWAAWFAAEPVVLGFDTLTLRVGRPPSTPQDALAATVEMALYCTDIVHQGVETLDALLPMAASSAWWFWWD